MPTVENRSTNSLSTTASTSSRTLKTPQSKLDHPLSPAIASGSGWTDDHSSSPVAAIALRRAKEVVEPRSPTPTQPQFRDEGRISSQRVFRDRLSPPPLKHIALLPTQAGEAALLRKQGAASTQSSHIFTRPRPPPLAPLDIKKGNRLSEGWVAINLAAPSGSNQMHAGGNSPLLAEACAVPHHPARLPQAKMIPVKESMVPSRPGFERASSAPPLSPMERIANEGRSSFDYMKTRTASPTPFRTKQDSFRTPPSDLLDTPILLDDHRPIRNPSPLRARSSDAVLRPSVDSVRGAMSKKDSKAIHREQQQALGVASTVVSASSAPEGEKRTTGLSLKKSSGALKALFIRGASSKGKERADTPPMPSLVASGKMRSRPSTAPHSDSRPRLSFGRPKTPDFSAEYQTSPFCAPGRSSLSSDRAIYGAPPMERAISRGSHPSMILPPRPRLPSRDLPPLPPPSPKPPPETRPAQPTLAEALPTSSLPYLSPLRASFLLGEIDAQGGPKPMESTSITSSSASTTRPPAIASGKISPIKPSRSLHLLQLPDLDLAMNFSFDKMGMSPSTPHKTPHGPSQIEPSTGSPTPPRTRTNTTPSKSSPKVSQPGSQRRRSKSFDGPGSGTDVWRSDANKLFVSSTSSSAPMLSNSSIPLRAREEPLAMAPKPVPRHRQNSSLSSQPSVPSTMDHTRTPSNTSSTNETPSPSPPHTPREEKTLAGLGFGDLDSPTSAPTPTPPALDTTETPSFVPKPFVLNEPPSIPLPDAPAPAPAKVAALAPSPEIGSAKPVEPEKTRTTLKGPRENKRVLLNKSKIVVPESNASLKSLGREVELLLYSSVQGNLTLSQTNVRQIPLSLRIVEFRQPSAAHP